MNKRRLRSYLKKFEELVIPKKFDIQSYVCGDSYTLLVKQLTDHNCGTTACGVGYLPVFYPRTFEFKGFLPILKVESRGSARFDSEKYFGIDKEEWIFLFGMNTESENPEFGRGKQGLINRLNHLLEKGL